MSIWKDIDKVKHAIAQSKTRYETLERLNRSPTSAMYRRLKIFEYEHDVDISHYEPWKTTKRKQQYKGNRTRTNEEMFRENSNVATFLLKKRIRQDNLIEYKCAECINFGEWRNKPLVLHLEHKNGIHNDNRLENLCFLCPNCHSQTPTYCGRNTTQRVIRSREEQLAERKRQLYKKHQPDINKVLHSGIDFSKYGWSVQVARLLNKNPQKVKDWMTRYMPDLYARCFHRTNR